MTPRKPKQIGTAAESAVLRACRQRGFPLAERHPLKGARDEGDLWLCPGVIIEVKARKTPPGPGLIQDWLAETEQERLNAKADTAGLVYRAKGIAEINAHLWPVYVRFGWLDLHTRADNTPIPLDRTPVAEKVVAMTLETWLILLRIQGWGDQLEVQS